MSTPVSFKPGPASARAKRALTPTDIEWIKSLPSDPSKVSAEDAATWGGMVQEVADAGSVPVLER